MDMSGKKQDAESILIDRLNESLMERAAGIGSYTSIGELHEFGAAIRLHEYLTMEHSFTHKEIAALMEFRDPLEAAVHAMGEIDISQNVDICYRLERSGARKELPLVRTKNQDGKMSRMNRTGGRNGAR